MHFTLNLEHYVSAINLIGRWMKGNADTHVVASLWLDRAKIYVGYGNFKEASATCEQSLQLHYSYGTESLISIRELSGLYYHFNQGLSEEERLTLKIIWSGRGKFYVT
ncbi:hypothetical protein SAMN05216436_1291 [bacterium A37T11]|nr:hypothetical protein SAMN05216436_1291 [bacterium A37T11]